MRSASRDAARARRERVVPWVVLAVALALAGIAASVWRPLAPPPLGTPTELDRFAPEVVETVRAYRAPREWAALAALVASAVVAVLVIVTSPGHALVTWLGGRGPGARWWEPPARAAAVGAGTGLLLSLVHLPFAFALGYVQDGRYGFRTTGLLGWLRDWTVGHAVSWVVFAAAAAVLILAVARWPRTWHWRLVPAGVAAAALLVALHPMAIQPLLLTTWPLEPGPVRTAVEGVLVAAGEPDVEILVGDASRRTTRINAFVTGLGPSRQVVLFDTLLQLPADEVAVVVAHELAHREHRDIPRGVLLSAAGILPALLVLRRAWDSPRLRARLGATGARDPRLAAVLVAVVVLGEALATPVANHVSRRAEAAADHRALELTQDPATQIRLSRIFTVRDLSDPDPPAWVVGLWRTHPTVGQRIRAAVDFAAREGLDAGDIDEVRAAEADWRHPRIVSTTLARRDGPATR